MGRINKTTFGCVTRETLDNEQVKALPTTGLQIVLPGKNQIFLPVLLTMSFDVWFADYGTIQPATEIQVDSSGATTGSGIFSDALFAPGKPVLIFSIIGTPVILDFTMFQNIGIELLFPNGVLGDYTGGDPRNQLHVKCFFIEHGIGGIP